MSIEETMDHLAGRLIQVAQEKNRILERIADALEDGNRLRLPQDGHMSRAEADIRVESIIRKRAEEIEGSKLADNPPTEKDEPETKPEKKPEKEKPKYDFNKEVRGPYVDLLQNVAKSRLGPKETTKLAKKLLKAFTGQIEEVLSVKTLPEEKYELFIAAVKEYRSQILNDKYTPIADED